MAPLVSDCGHVCPVGSTARTTPAITYLICDGVLQESAIAPMVGLFVLYSRSIISAIENRGLSPYGLQCESKSSPLKLFLQYFLLGLSIFQ